MEVILAVQFSCFGLTRLLETVELSTALISVFCIRRILDNPYTVPSGGFRISRSILSKIDSNTVIVQKKKYFSAVLVKSLILHNLRTSVYIKGLCKSKIFVDTIFWQP